MPSPFIGTVKTVSGAAFIRHNGGVARAQPGTQVFVGDILQTEDGTLGVTFKDNTRIALGGYSRVVVPEFVFEPAQKHFGFLLRIVKGTIAYISGLTEKLAPKAMKIETPTATISVRGTKLLIRAGD